MEELVFLPCRRKCDSGEKLPLIKKAENPEGWDAQLMWVRAAPRQPERLFEL